MKKLNVKLPACWRTLVDHQFPPGLAGALSEKQDHTGTADPKPHYDDLRGVTVVVDGLIVGLSLSSGQHNYYGGLGIWRGDEVEYEVVDPLENFENLTVKGESGEEYEIVVEWVPDDQWTDPVEPWKLELRNGDEVTLAVEGEPTVTISTIEWRGNVAKITDKDGERYEVKADEIT